MFNLTSGVNMAQVVNRISEIAGKRRMQVSDIARESGLPYMTVRRQWEGIAKGISYETMAALCAALNVQPGDLFSVIDDNK